MHVVIDSDCSSIPDGINPFNSEGNALLNFLLSVGYDPVNPPLAELLKRHHNLEGQWLIMTPIHWEATHNDAMIVAWGKDLQLSQPEAKSWFDLFSQYFAEENALLYFHDSETWLLCRDNQVSIEAKPPHHLLHQSLMPELAKLDKTMFWQKFITEVQMFFASQANQSVANGLWVWGGGKLKDKIPINICVDEHYYPIAQIVSNQVTLYRPEIKLKDQQILLLKDFSMLSARHQEELSSISVQWFWNNVAYSTAPHRWYVRLWRKLIHAH
ncbi:Uncharacterized protein conserved in bacteria [Legionella wadsworthii]|uniref:Uncharacterized protein conserved in bacteria n=1 Tax=Legionella wadsworthii TaxID=28088 RepID=A0A378LSQ2_9GAMM|nr:hypothetical protein [Legionella wadsworthii]STY29380.1 Uncharacterized protein conserved in bacteria [Legionella wadsworthii]